MPSLPSGRFRTISAIYLAALLLVACGDDASEDADISADVDADAEDDADASPDDDAGSDDADAGPDDDAEDDADAGPDDDAGSDDDAGGDEDVTGGIVTLNGESVELTDAYACEDYTGFIAGGSEASGLTTDLFTVGRIVTEEGGYGAKLLAGTYHTDEGTLEDHVAIYSWDTFDDAPVTGSWSVSEDEDGYPWIDIDGDTVTVDGTHTDEDGNEWVFDAEVEFEITDGAVRCP